MQLPGRVLTAASRKAPVSSCYMSPSSLSLLYGKCQQHSQLVVQPPPASQSFSATWDQVSSLGVRVGKGRSMLEPILPPCSLVGPIPSSSQSQPPAPIAPYKATSWLSCSCLHLNTSGPADPGLHSDHLRDVVTESRPAVFYPQLTPQHS